MTNRHVKKKFPIGKRRLALLVSLPLGFMGVLLILSNLRPATDASVEVVNAKRIGFALKGEQPFDRLDLLKGVVIKRVPVILEASRIQIDQLANSTYQQVSLEPLDDGMEVTHDFSESEKKDLAFSIASKDQTALWLTHASAKSAFSLFFNTIGTDEVKGRITFPLGPEEIVLQVKGARIITGSSSGSIDVPVDQVRTIRLYSGNETINQAQIGFAISGKPNTEFLRVSYPFQSNEGLDIFADKESESLGLATIPSSEPAIDLGGGVLTLSVEGTVIGDFKRGKFLLQGQNVNVLGGIKASGEGIKTTFQGTFNYVDRASANSRRPLLPTQLSRLTGVYGIVIAAAIYLLDKLITVYNFLAPKND